MTEGKGSFRREGQGKEVLEEVKKSKKDIEQAGWGGGGQGRSREGGGGEEQGRPSFRMWLPAFSQLAKACFLS